MLNEDISVCEQVQISKTRKKYTKLLEGIIELYCCHNQKLFLITIYPQTNILPVFFKLL